MTKPFKLRSHSAVKKSGFKMMGSSPMKQAPYEEKQKFSERDIIEQYKPYTISEQIKTGLGKEKPPVVTEERKTELKEKYSDINIELRDLQNKIDELTQRGREEQGGQGEEIVGYDEQGQPIYGRETAPPPDVEVVPQPGIEAENAIFQLISDKIGKSVDYVKNLSQEKLDRLKSRFITNE